MTDYYCDISASGFNDRSGVDSGANVLTGPAGLQAAIRGTGNATALAAGDTILIQGTGDLSRLVLIDCGQDMSDWEIQDAILNDSGASTWTGKVVEVSVGGDDNVLLVWLDDGYDVDDVLLAGGIETLDPIATPSSVATLNAVSAPGVTLESEGSASGLIKLVGVNASWTEDGELAWLDGGGLAAKGFTSSSNRSYYELRNVGVTDYTGGAFADGYEFRYSYFSNCEVSDCYSGFGRPTKYMRYCNLVRCRAYNNSSYGFAMFSCHASLCTAYNNGTYGFYCYITALSMCVSYEQTYGAMVLAAGSSISNCVFDSNAYGISAVSAAPGNLLLACRITNNSSFGIKGSVPFHDQHCFYGDNGANFENDIHDDTDDGTSTRVTTGMIGYIDGDNATLADRNYGLTNQASARRMEVTL